MKRMSILVVMVMVFALAAPVLASTPGELLIWADDVRAEILNDVAASFEEEYGIPVTVQELAFGDIRDNLAVTGPAGEGPDILVGAHDWLGELVVNGLIEPVDLYDESQFVDVGLDAWRWGEDLYALPYSLESIGMFYNKDLVGEEAPDTFDELIEISKGLAEDGIYGLVMPQPDPYHTFPFFSALGGYVFGEDEEGVLNPLDVGLNNEGAVAGLEFFKKLMDEQVMPRAIDYDTMMSLFTDGRAAFMITGPWALAEVRGAGVDYGFARIPAIDGAYGRPFVGVQGFMVSAFSENQMLANIFLNEFIATTDTMLAIFEQDPRPSPYLPAAEIVNEDPDMAGVLEAAEVGVPMPAIPEMAAVWEAWSDAIELIINQQSTPQQALDDAVALINATIGESR